MLRFILLIVLLGLSAFSLVILAVGAHQGFGPQNNRLLAGILAVLVAAGLIWYKVTFQKDKVWFVSGILIIIFPIGVYSFLFISNLRSVQNTEHLREKLMLTQYSEEIILLPETQLPIGVHLQLTLEAPKGTGGQVYGPLISDTRRPVAIGNNYFSDTYAPKFFGLHPLIRASQQSLHEPHQVLTYDLYPMQVEIVEPLKRVCFRGKDIPTDLNEVKSLAPTYWIADTGGEVDVSSKLRDLIKSSKLIGADQIRQIYKSLNDLDKVGYLACEARTGEDSGLSCYCHP